MALNEKSPQLEHARLISPITHDHKQKGFNWPAALIISRGNCLINNWKLQTQNFNDLHSPGIIKKANSESIGSQLPIISRESINGASKSLTNAAATIKRKQFSVISKLANESPRLMTEFLYFAWRYSETTSTMFHNLLKGWKIILKFRFC